jgi:TonB family protein
MRAMALCGTDGKPHDVRVARALGYGLDEKAVQAVKVWRFEPAMKDGQPVAAQINVTVSFRLWSMSVSPKSAQLAPGATQQFHAKYVGFPKLSHALDRKRPRLCGVCMRQHHRRRALHRTP